MLETENRLDSLKTSNFEGPPPVSKMTVAEMRGLINYLSPHKCNLHTPEAEVRRLFEQIGDAQLRSGAMRRAAKLFHDAWCPLRHIEKINDTDGAPDRWRATRDLLHRQSRYAAGFLVALIGPSGTGKTQMCVNLIYLAAIDGLSCRYVKASDIFRHIRRTYKQPTRGERSVSDDEVIAGYASYDLLVIDEVHQRGETQAENNSLVSILDHRYDAKRCTVLIANQNKEAFATSVGDSIVSRIHETGTAIECNWPSFRIKGNWVQKEDAALRNATRIETGGDADLLAMMASIHLFDGHRPPYSHRHRLPGEA